MSYQSYSVPQIARRLGVHEDAVRDACDRLGNVPRVGRYRAIPESMVARVAEEIGVELRPVAEIRQDMHNYRVGVRGDGKLIIARIPIGTSEYDIDRCKQAFAVGDVGKALDVLSELDGEIAFVVPATEGR